MNESPSCRAPAERLLPLVARSASFSIRMYSGQQKFGEIRSRRRCRRPGESRCRCLSHLYRPERACVVCGPVDRRRAAGLRGLADSVGFWFGGLTTVSVRRRRLRRRQPDTRLGALRSGEPPVRRFDRRSSSCPSSRGPRVPPRVIVISSAAAGCREPVARNDEQQHDGDVDGERPRASCARRSRGSAWAAGVGAASVTSSHGVAAAGCVWTPTLSTPASAQLVQDQ